ncbi:DUF4404 family protein [Saccharophagus degradans]|uniref:DUF4404 family protein n=1 Tax=Saccharophagus degradans TaxID=86304 RepID=A0AAW7X342_9GAMM|nr:DUF4404 family protein [Saccharophagus degradans]MDO6421949.1 DUF4404 family protein [Saccharophagus degradans]MDO6606358.1 DUF4404 family protein [Saccharophagus degradans]
MPKSSLPGLLTKLHDALGDTEITNTDLQAKVSEFERSLKQQLENEAQVNSTSLQDQINQLEAEFAAEHPTAERILREIMDVLSRIGV